jgi:hypothetical protein
MTAITGVGGKNEVQTITNSGGVAGDKFRLAWNAANTGWLAYDITGANLQTALEGLAGIDPGDVSVAGDGPYAVTFQGLLAKTDVAAITAVAGQNEVQTVTLSGAATGTFTLSYAGQPTANINWDASAADVQDALEGLNNIANGDVLVTKDGLVWSVEFTGNLAKTDVAMLVEDETNLVGATIAIAEAIKGNGAALSVGIVETFKGNELTVGVVETFKGNELTVGVVETFKGNELTVGVVETFKGNELTVGVVETNKGNSLTVGVVETAKGNLATVTVTESIKGDADGTVTVASTAQASDGCNYSWIAS